MGHAMDCLIQASYFSTEDKPEWNITTKMKKSLKFMKPHWPTFIKSTKLERVIPYYIPILFLSLVLVAGTPCS